MNTGTAHETGCCSIREPESYTQLVIPVVLVQTVWLRVQVRATYPERVGVSLSELFEYPLATGTRQGYRLALHLYSSCLKRTIMILYLKHTNRRNTKYAAAAAVQPTATKNKK